MITSGDAASAERKRALALLAVSLVLAMSTWFSASAVVPQLREEWALSDTAAAWLTISVQIGFVIGALISSILNVTDIVPPARVLLGGAIGAATANGLLLVAEGPKLALPVRLATGFFIAGIYPSALKIAATWFQKGRGFALGILVAAVTVGSASPHLINGLGGLDWELVVVVTSVLTLVGGATGALVRDGPFPFPRAVFDPRQFRRAFSNRGVRLASLGYFGHMWELYAMWAWFVVFFRESVGRNEGTQAALATFVVIGVGGAGCVVGGVLSDRWGRERTTILMMLVSAGCALTIGLVRGGPTAVLLLVGLVWGFSVVADSAQFSTLVTEHADPAYVGTAVTLQLAVGFTLTVATIWVIPLFEDAVGWKWAFAVLAPGPLLGSVAMWLLQRGNLRRA